MASRAPPSEEEISQVIDFAGLSPQDDRPMVIQALKVRQPRLRHAWHAGQGETSLANLIRDFQENGGNVEAVVMQYFDNPESVSSRCAVYICAGCPLSLEDCSFDKSLHSCGTKACSPQIGMVQPIILESVCLALKLQQWVMLPSAISEQTQRFTSSR